ncbi:site-specific integrase [Methylomarinum sp. Ch1-1]|uniref:Site-specific integrase n=1 Tax=Methylomarinum roseum TaxID=3067653 RepID=A0AAU7NZR6_9GAMM
MGPVDITNHAVFRLQLFNDRFSGYSLTKWQIEGFFKKLTKLSGTRISAHRLRHTFATLIAQSGENPDLKSLQYILGHTDIRTTMAYIEPQKKHLEQVLNQLSLDR